mgnify:CR=1 FL=1
MENNKNQKITLPVAIIVAGFLITIAIFATGRNISNKNTTDSDKPLSEQVGIDSTKFKQCLDETDLQKLVDTTNSEADIVMKNIPAEQRGTPYSVIIGKNGSKTDVRGAYTLEEMKKLIEEVSSGKVTNAYTAEIPEVTANDHIIGDINAPIVVVEYSDLECPYCKRFGGVMDQLVKDSNGPVAWVSRHWIVHQGAVSKTAAAECVAKLKGNDAFWKYINLTFGLIKTQDDINKEALNKL